MHGADALMAHRAAADKRELQVKTLDYAHQRSITRGIIGTNLPRWTPNFPPLRAPVHAVRRWLSDVGARGGLRALDLYGRRQPREEHCCPTPFEARTPHWTTRPCHGRYGPSTWPLDGKRHPGCGALTPRGSGAFGEGDLT